MKIISVAGFKNSGKTSLCRELLSRLESDGLRVGYVKRTHESLTPDGGTDSGRVGHVGNGVLLWSGRDFRFERSVTSDPAPEAVASLFFPDADIVIMEGGKELRVPKIWVLGEGEERPDFPGICAVYDRFGAGDGGDVYGRDDLPRLTERISQMARRGLASARVYIDDVELPMKGFIQDFVEGSVRGMLGALKGVRDGGRSGEIRIYIGDAKNLEE